MDVLEQWNGLFTMLSPDPVSILLGTGFLRFSTPFGMNGLVRFSADSIEYLAVDTTTPGRGHFRTLIEQSKKRARVVTVLFDMNPVVTTALERYGFTLFLRKDEFGETLQGWEWTA